MIVLIQLILPYLSRLLVAIGGIWLANKIISSPTIFTSRLSEEVQNSASVITGGLIPPAPASAGADVPSVRPQDAALNQLTNPWFYFGLGFAALGGTYLVRQLRGAGRDLGSGVRSLGEAP